MEIAMKKFIKNAVWSVLAFFGILLAIGYLNDSYVGMKKMISDPINWIVIAMVIAASYLIKLRRHKREALENE